jgi:hypothetical protein
MFPRSLRILVFFSVHIRHKSEKKNTYTTSLSTVLFFGVIYA